MILPSIHDADSPNAMVNAAGERFYPDNAEDAAFFAEHHGAEFVSRPTSARCPSRLAKDGVVLRCQDVPGHVGNHVTVHEQWGDDHDDTFVDADEPTHRQGCLKLSAGKKKAGRQVITAESGGRGWRFVGRTNDAFDQDHDHRVDRSPLFVGKALKKRMEVIGQAQVDLLHGPIVRLAPLWVYYGAMTELQCAGLVRPGRSCNRLVVETVATIALCRGHRDLLSLHLSADSLLPTQRTGGLRPLGKSRRPMTNEVVYYFESPKRGLVKIGTSMRLRARINQLRRLFPGSVLLATEPGGVGVETERHRKFSMERKEGEWFEPSVRLRQWIASVREEYQLVGTYRGTQVPDAWTAVPEVIESLPALWAHNG